MGKVKKQHLPAKICPVCGFSFAWRKKWEKNWDEVVYCSQRCRQSKSINQQSSQALPS
jgi:hypothetical protein